MSDTGKRYQIDGYSFASEQEYLQAKKEAESVVFIRSEIDVNRPEQVLAAYRRAVAKGGFRTPIGYDFLRQMQRYLMKREDTKKGLPSIPVAPQSDTRKEKTEFDQRAYEEKTRRELEREYRRRFRNHRIVSAFLIVLVIVLLVFTWREVHPDVEAEREQILNEYAGWKEELDKREQVIREKEYELGIAGNQSK